MNVSVFIKSLSELERRELRNFFLMNPEVVTTKDLIKRHDMSSRLRGVLENNSGEDDVFKYTSQINKIQFMRLDGAGEVAWKELEILLKNIK